MTSAYSNDQIVAFEQEEMRKLRQQVAVIEQQYQQALAKQSATNKELVAQLDESRRVANKQREDFDKLWKWVKAVEQRLMRVERGEPAKSRPTP